MIRSRAILDLARDQPCMSCGIQDGTIVAAHSNSKRHGKGMGCKADDCMVAWLCSTCHALCDGQAGSLSRSERLWLWHEAYANTMHRILTVPGLRAKWLDSMGRIEE